MHERKKKILFVITKSNWGGAQRYVFDLATTFANQNDAVSVALGGRGALVEKLQKAGIETIEIPDMKRDISLADDLKAAFFLWRLLRKEKPDVLHLNSSKAGLGALAGRLAGVKKIVFTLHGLALNEDRPGWQKFLIRNFYRLTIIFSHQTIAVSNALRSQAGAVFPMLAKKIILIHNGLLIPEFLSRQEARGVLIHAVPNGKTVVDIESASIVFGTVGELHPIKGHQYLVEGFKEALDKSAVPLYLFIVSDGEEYLKRQKQIDSLKLGRHVFLCGRIDDAIRILKAFDIFVFPSLSEGLPYAVQEAGLAGLPVIATDVGGIPEIIEDGKTGILIKPRSSKEIASAMLDLVYDPELRKKLGSGIQKKVASDFSVESMTRATETVYNL